MCINGGGKHTFKMGKVGFLIERGRVETERANDVVDLLLCIFSTLLSFFSRSVGTSIYNLDLLDYYAPMVIPALVDSINSGGVIFERTNADSANSDHAAVDLVDDTINLLQVVRVGDDLIFSDNIL